MYEWTCMKWFRTINTKICRFQLRVTSCTIKNESYGIGNIIWTLHCIHRDVNKTFWYTFFGHIDKYGRPSGLESFFEWFPDSPDSDLNLTMKVSVFLWWSGN